MASCRQILLVEDNSAHAELILRSLRAGNDAPSVVHRNNGEQAVNYLEQELETGNGILPCLILLDLSLPRMNGHEVLAWIRGQPRLNRIPVVVLSTSADAKDLRRAYEARANSYLVKPDVFEEFTGLMQQLSEYWLNVNYCG